MIKKFFALASILFLLWLSASGCTRSGDAQKPNGKASSRPPVAVEAVKVALSELSEGIDVVGSLSYKFGAEIKSEYAGIVNEVYVAEWVTVRKGARLARVDTRELEINLQKARAAAELARANLVQAEAAGSRAERHFERYKKLGELGAIALLSLDDARTESEVTAARIAAASAQLKVAEEDVQHAQMRFSKAVIHAPIDGVVSFRGVNVGDLVGEAGSTKVMFRIINPRILELTVTVPSREMEAVRVGQSLTFLTDAFPEKTFNGRVMFINPTVNEADRSVKVTAEVDNLQGHLKGGLFVKGRIITGKRSGVLKIPRSALLNWDVAAKKGELFVVDGGIARRRTVATGSVLDDFVEITSGVQNSDQVITRGGFNVKDGDRVILTPAHGG